jgi:hypothetical protein
MLWNQTPCSVAVLPIFRRDVLTPASGSKSKLYKQVARGKLQAELLDASYSLDYHILCTEDGGSMLLRNVEDVLPDYTVPLTSVCYVIN